MLIGTVQEIWRYPVKSMAGESLSEVVVEQMGVAGDRGWALRDDKRNEITNGKRIPPLMQCAAQYRETPINGNIPQVDITFPDGSQVGSDDADVNRRLSNVLGREVSLWPRQPATNKNHYRRNDPSARVMGPLMRRVPGFRALMPGLTKLPNVQSALREAFSREPGEPVPDISNLPADVLEFTSPLGTYFDAFTVNVLTTASLEKMAEFNPSAAWDVRRFRPNFLIKTEGLDGLVESTWAGKTLRIGSVELKCEIPCARCGMTTHAQKELPKDSTVLRSIVKDANQNLSLYASVKTPGTVSIGDSVELVE